MRYIQSFSTSGTEHEAIDQGLLGIPYICFIEDGQYIDWYRVTPPGPGPEPEYSGVPLTFEILSAGTISYEREPGDEVSATSKYSINDGAYSTLASAWTVNVQPGDKVSVIGDCPYSTDGEYPTYSYFTFGASTAVFNLYGNGMSLLTENFTGATSFSGLGHFCNSFMNTKVVDASNLVLPVLDLSSQPHCYTYMFYHCSGLTAAPKLPATAISEYCYMSMFDGCTSLTASPVLPAQTPKEGCYIYMFNGCSSLSQITCLLTGFTDSLWDDPSTQHWDTGVAASGTFYKAPGMNDWQYNTDTPAPDVYTDDRGVPQGWTILDASI